MCIGMITVKAVPSPGVDRQSMLPLSVLVTILKTMCRPSPVPPEPRFVVKNGS
jgi:hypothetical protein